ncbi:hypothetical protein N7495_002923 [Penicillium taxi]|uniref:uncharacterized protein n=1 Tax=Penicillium taxi TaxID=168475 RepID=UPI002545867D|nr:uncharacterized protein N7495_002923 [Penicillium taxi]KAJ5902395.1 hypothetical protein N7495_002923 [Penicillium taxi]
MRSAPLSPPPETSEQNSNLSVSEWVKLSHSVNMSSSTYTRHSPALQDQDPYLSAPSDPEELDFKAHAIRLTPLGGSPNIASSPIESHDLSPPQNDWYNPSTCVSPSVLSGRYVDPSDIDFANGSGWPDRGAAALNTMGTTSAISALSTWSDSLPAQQEPAQPGPGTNQAYASSGLVVSTNHTAGTELASASTQGRSPIILTVSGPPRGDSPDFHSSHKRHASRSSTHLSPGGFDEFEEEVGDEIEELRSVPSLFASRADNGQWIRNSTTGQGGLDPSARGTEYVSSPNMLKGIRELEQKNQRISNWFAQVSATKSEAGDDQPRPSRTTLSPPKPNRPRARSTGDNPLKQEDYFSLKFHTGPPTPGPGVLLQEESESEGEGSGDEGSLASEETASDSLPADPGRHDYTSPGIFPSREAADSVRVYPWHDDIRDSIPRMEPMQPYSSSAAMMIYQMRAREIETASLTATVDADSIRNFESLSLTDNRPKTKYRSRSLLSFKRPSFGLSSNLKRQASELTTASIETSGEQGTEHDTPQRKESQSIRHRYSLSSKVHSLSHSRSPSLTSGLLSLTGSITAIGANNVVHAAAPNTDATLSPPAKVRQRRSISEIPRPNTPGLMELMTSHGGPPVASIQRYLKPGSNMGRQMASVTPEPDKTGAEDEDDDHLDHAEDSAMKMEFPPISELPVPTFEGFQAQIMQMNPRLVPALTRRFAQEQVRRYKKLVDHQQKHAAAVAKGTCKSGEFCKLQGGSPILLEQGKSSAPTEPCGQTQFRVANSTREHPYYVGEGSFAAAQFPAGVPLPPAHRLPAEFECSVCFGVKKFHKPSDWSKHIHEDLQPFTCSFPQCTEPKSFKRKADWVRHENECHRKLEWWACSYSGCTHTCARKNNFKEHLVREHKFPDPKMKKGAVADDGFSASERDKLVARLWAVVEDCRQETQQTPNSEPCRFCGNICSTWGGLARHLGKHMEQLAIPVLELAKQTSAPSQGQSGQCSIQVQPLGVENSSRSAETYPPASLTVPLGRHDIAQPQYATSDASTSSHNHNFYDLQQPGNYSTIAGIELSMEPEQIPDQLQPNQYTFNGLLLDQATMPQTQTQLPHQNSVSYPPPFNVNARPEQYDNQFYAGNSLYPVPVPVAPASVQASYPPYQAVAPNPPYIPTPPGSNYPQM